MSAQSLPLVVASASIRLQRAGHSALIWRRSSGTSSGGSGTGSSSASTRQQTDMFIVFGGSVGYNRSANAGSRMIPSSDVLGVQLDDDRTAAGDPKITSLFVPPGVSADDSTIPPRYSAAAAIVGDFLWVFGGLDANNIVFNDTWRFNLATSKAWTRIPVTGAIPSARGVNGSVTPGLHRASMIPSSDGRFLIVYGGRGPPDSAAGAGSDGTVVDDPGVPQNGLWVLDTVPSANKRATWYEVRLNGVAGVLLPGYDTTIALVDKELVIMTSGALNQTQPRQTTATSGGPSTLRQWITVARSNTSGRFEERLKAFVNQVNSATTAAAAAAITADIPFTLTAAFVATDFNASMATLYPTGSSFTWVIASTNIYRQLPVRVPAVRDAGIAISPSGTELFFTGGTDVLTAMGTKTYFARPNFLKLDPALGMATDCVQQLGAQFAGGSSDGTTVDTSRFKYTSAVHMAVPTSAGGMKQYHNNLTNTLMLLGRVVDSSPEDTPKLTEIDIIDISAGNHTNVCSPDYEATQGRCSVRTLSHTMGGNTTLPVPRLGAAFQSIYQVFHWFEKSKHTNVVPMGMGMVLMYGGQGNPYTPAQATGKGSSSMSNEANYIADVLGQCDKSLPVQTLIALAQCSADKFTRHFQAVCDDAAPPLDEVFAPPPNNWDYGGDTIVEEYAPPAAAPLFDPSPDPIPNVIPAGAGAEPPGSSGAHHRRLLGSWSFDGIGGGLQRQQSGGTGLKRRRALADGSLPPPRRRLQQQLLQLEDDHVESARAAEDIGSIFADAYVMFYVDSAMAAATRTSPPYINMDLLPATLASPAQRDNSKKQAAVYFDSLVASKDMFYEQEGRTNGSHSPGARAGATLTGLPPPDGDDMVSNADALLFGGMSGPVTVTNDIHYLQFLPYLPFGFRDKDPAVWGPSGSGPQPRFQPCPFPDISMCKSVKTKPLTVPPPPPPPPPSPAPPSPAPFPPNAPYRDAPIGAFYFDPPEEAPEPPLAPPPQPRGTPQNLDCLDDALVHAPTSSNGNKQGTFKLRLFASANTTYTNSMGVYFISRLEDGTTDHVSRQFIGRAAQNSSKYKCCAGNMTAGAWSYESPSFKIQVTPVIEVWLTSGVAPDWTSPLDMEFGCGLSNPAACPRIELYSVDARRTVKGYGRENIWDDITGDAVPGRISSADRWKLTILNGTLCARSPAPPRPPPPPPAVNPDNPFPLHPKDGRHRLRSFEVLLAAKSQVPEARHRHASTFVDTSSRSELGPDAQALGYGSQGLLIVFGGTTEADPNANDPAQLLGDMWAFSLEYRNWTKMDGAGDRPGQRLRASMTTYNSVIFLTGGYTYDAVAQKWVSTSDVYYMDLRFGFGALWTKIKGNARTIANDANPGWLTEGAAIDLHSKRLIAPNKQMLVYVPLPVTVEVEKVYLNRNRSLGGASSGAVDVGLLAGITSQLYDGDLLLLPQTVPIRINTNISVSRAVLLHGRTNVGSSGRRLLSAQEEAEQGLLGLTVREGGDASSPHPHGRVLVGRVAPGQSEMSGAQLQQMLTAPDPSMVLENEQQMDQLLAESRAAEYVVARHVRRALQQAMAASPGAPPAQSPADIAADMLTVNRTLVICESNSTWLVDSSPTFINIEFRNCHFLLSRSADANPVTFINCIFRNTVLRPVVVVTTGAAVVVRKSAFLNNTADGLVYDDCSGCGSAIHVSPRGIIQELSDTVFLANGNSPSPASTPANSGSTPVASANGGAIYMVGPGACLRQISKSYFAGNGRRAGTPGAFSGGAIFTRYADGCDMSIHASVFTDNVASGSGGAVYMSPILISKNYTITNTSFQGNVANGDGGAIYVSSFVGVLNLASVTIRNNTASSRGGGVALEEIATVNLVGLDLSANSASTGVGGGMSVRLGTVSLQSSVIRGNKAFYGGGVGGGNGLRLTMADVNVTENAASHAGGVECYQCTSFVATRTHFVSNLATSAGGLSLMQVEQGGELSDCGFVSNVGRPTNTAKLSEASCSRDTLGGGGAVCVILRKPVTIRGGAMSNNTAVSGGGLYVQQRCILGEDEAGCGALAVTGVSFRDNVALGGGGGVLFQSWHNLTSVTCAGANTQLQPQQLAAGCSEWQNNTARYGPNAATNAYYIQPATTSMRQYRSNDKLNMTVVVLDFHNQTIIDASREASTNLEMVYNPVSKINPFNTSAPLLTGNSITAAAGVGIFGESLRISAVPSNYSMLLTAPKTFQSLAPVEVTLEVRECYRGEVTNSKKDACYPCEPGKFSINPQNFTCDACPDNANCTVLGYPWVTLPEDGYWKSGPYSPNMVECAVEDACKGTDTWDRQANLTAYMMRLGNNYGADYNVSEFWALQCSYGYYGNLCGRCIAGWGQKTNGECGQCASRAVNIVYYILSNFVNIIIIALTVMSQLPESVTAQKRQKRIADYIAHKHLHDADAAAEHPLQHLTDAERVNTIGRAGGKGSEAPDAGEKLGVAASMARGGGDKPGAAEDEHSHLDFHMEVEAEGAEASDDNVDPEAEEGPYKGGNYAIVWKILISYLQVTAMVRKIAFVWPSFIMGLLASAKQVANTATTIVSVDCCLVEDSTPISIQRTLITIFTPFVILGLATITWLLVFWWKRRKVPTLPFMLWAGPRLVITVIAIIFNAYPDLVTAFVELFSCQQIDDPDATDYAPVLHAQGSYWGSDPNLECYVNPHLWLAMAIGIPGIVLFAVGCPLFSYYWLRRHKKLLYGSTKRAKNFAIAYAFMYEDYSERAYFWDSMIMLRKLAVVIVITFLEPISPQLQILTALGVIIIALVAQMLVHPYKNARMNYMERLSLWATMTMLYCALYFSSGDVPQAAKTVIGAVLLLFNIVVVAYFVLQYVYEYILGWLYLMDEKNDNDGNFTWEDVHTFLRDDHPKFYSNCAGCISCVQSCCLSIYHCFLPCYARWRAFTGDAPPGTPEDALGRLPTVRHFNAAASARYSVGSRQGSAIGAHYSGTHSRQGSGTGRLHPAGKSAALHTSSQPPLSAPDQQLMQSVPSLGTGIGSHRLSRASRGTSGGGAHQPQMAQQWGAAAAAALGSAPPSGMLAEQLPGTDSGIVAMIVEPGGSMDAPVGLLSAGSGRASEGGASGRPPLPPRPIALPAPAPAPTAPAPAPAPLAQLQSSGEVDASGVVVHVDT
ncbi:hypothetical protein HYH02_001630 [Chlamydomonas schloesseri]|uniref:TRP C-terminal domain-containing protein n=1 Tax=Chlamydomonas schloesseri TaxID=2026947 RepID=A0A835WTZ3_9CHLO|nr:hypothetical protein HYH02_001630 [Chlamydomonas schloesseri]|eukprot:KAG2453407.1 hypothetical protein HYH02_001630 [Chlamydomonas schloesseri]